MSLLSQIILLKRSNTSDDSELTDRVYCTIDGVLTPVVYKSSEDLYTTYDDLFTSSIKKTALQQSLKGVRSLSKSLSEQGVTISPVCVFDYHTNIETSGAIDEQGHLEIWGSSFGDLAFRQASFNARPTIGLNAEGVIGSSPIYFKNGKFITLTESVELVDDFTLFFFIEPFASPLMTRQRLLGLSATDGMYLSIGESAFNSYRIQFSPSEFTDVDIDTTHWNPPTKKLLVTIQRINNKFIVRENQKEIASETVSTEPFRFDTFGRIGTSDEGYFNGGLYHFSAYDGSISNSLEDIETAIIKSASQVKGV